jgi:hypothetical protein
MSFRILGIAGKNDNIAYQAHVDSITRFQNWGFLHQALYLVIKA